MSQLEHHRIVWARADVASAHIRLLVEQAGQERFERAQAWVAKRQIDLHLLAEVIRVMNDEAANDKGAVDPKVLDTPTVLACHQGMQHLFAAVKRFEPLAESFLSEHGAGISKKDLAAIRDFIAWVKRIEPRLEALRSERLDKLEADLDLAGRDEDGADGDWEITIADGLDDDSPAC